MTFVIPSAADLRDRYLRALNAAWPELRTGTGTPARLEAAAVAQVVADNHQAVAQVDRDSNPLTASEAGLERWGEALGVERKPATGARGSQALEVRGSAGSVVDAGRELVSAGGLTFAISTNATIPASGVVLCDVEAIDTGSSTRLSAGETLRFTVPPTGVTQSARLAADLDDGGEDEELLGQWRQRILLRWRQGGQGGNRSDYTQWILESLPNVSSAYVYAAKPGLGWVSVVGLRTGEEAARLLSAAERDALLAYVEERRPVSDQVAVLEPVTRAVDVDIRIATLPAAAFDWDDEAGYTVASYDAATRVLTFGEPLPADLSAGDLLVIASADPATSGADGYPAQVAAILGADSVSLAPVEDRSTPLSWTPTAGDAIYASSYTALAVRDAIVDGFAIGCGPEAVAIAGINQLGTANPSRAYGDWDADVTRARLSVAALSIPGVFDLDVVTPASDVIAAEYPFPDTTVVELLVPRQILVRTL